MKPNNPAKAETVSLYRDVTVNALLDLADMHNVSKQESRRDCEEIHARVAAEGLPFLTVALPLLGKALDKALSSEERILDTQGFELEPGTHYPKFLRCYWSRVFDAQGLELPDADAGAVGAIRQLVYLLYKLEIPFEREVADRVVSEFVTTDNALPQNFEELQNSLSFEDWDVLDEASKLISDIFSGFDPLDIVPKHGPGAVATGELNHQKHRFKRLYLSIERVYPFTEYFCYSMSQVADEWRYWQGSRGLGLEVHQTGTAKVVLVPKDSRGPRLISCEPLEYQWIQQGLGTAFRQHAEKHPICQGQVNFLDQGINRRLALESSLGAPWVTLDMKEASDRVSLALIDSIFDRCPDLLAALRATRTVATRLPSGDVHIMRKFAPMGSNLCFPVESLVFYVLAVARIMHKDRETMQAYRGLDPRVQVSIRRRLIKRAAKTVYVYGDDIICRSEDYQLLLDFFPKVGLMFNLGKCCIQGSFRESCGLDAYKGVEVQPLRLKREWLVRRKQDAVTYASYVAFSNAAYMRGYHRVAELIAQLVEKDLGPLPIIGRKSYGQSSRQPEFEPLSALVLVRYGASVASQPPNVKTRYNKRLHRREVRCLLPTSRFTRVDPDDWSMVLRRFTSPSDASDPGIFPLAHRIYLKWAWIPLSNQD
jgi:hypothetical protein